MIPDNDALAKKFAVESNVHFIDDRLLKTDGKRFSNGNTEISNVHKK